MEPVYVAPPGSAENPAQTQRAQFANNAGNTSLSAQLAAQAGLTQYLHGFYVLVPGATAGSIIDVTITGCVGGVQHYPYAVPTGATIGGPLLLVEFNPPLPASAVNTAITLAVPAAGAGNTQQSGGLWGYSQ